MPQRNPQSQIIWDKLRCADCTQCELHKTAEKICLIGDGSVPSEGVVVGEAPGSNEESLQIPFSGKSGIFLRRMLKKIGLDPRTLYFTYVVHCRPPANREPSRKEAKICGPLYLAREIELLKPKAILLLGNTAVAWAMGKKSAVTKMEGSTFELNGITYIPSRHPSSVVRTEGECDYDYLVQKFMENLLLFKRVLFPQKDNFKFSMRLPNTKPIFKEDMPLCTDLESTGLNPFKEDATIHCVGFAQYPSAVVSIPIHRGVCGNCGTLESDYQREYDKDCDCGSKFISQLTQKQMKDILERYPIIAHRTTFEGMWYRRKYGVTPRIYYDTKVGAYLRDENEPSGLKYQAVRYLGVEPWSEGQDWLNPNFDKLLPYNARDTSYELRLYRERDVPFLKRNPKIARLLHYILLPAIEVLIEIICNGYHINEQEARIKLKRCRREKNKLNKELNTIAGWEINPGSPKQVAKLFYKQLGLQCPVKTAKGADSTGEPALVRLKGQHRATDAVWEWRGWAKYESTYLVPWLNKGPVLHALYDPTGTDTGRLASSMVKDTRNQKKLGAVIHQCPRDPFVRNTIAPRGYLPDPMTDLPPTNAATKREKEAHPEDWCMVAGDLSQAELRLVAHAANEPTMIQIFNCDPHSPEGDIHLATVMGVLNKKQSEIDKETRKKGKAVNFGFVYGMFAPKFQIYAKEKFELDLTIKEAKEYRKGFFRKYSGLLSWHKRVEQFVRANGFIDSVFGRRRHLPAARESNTEECPECRGRGLASCLKCEGNGLIAVEGNYDEWIQREAIRQGINSPIQSAGSDLLLFLFALIASYSLPWDFKIDRKRAFPVGTAHDSALFECRRDYAKELREGIIWTIENLPVKRYFGFEFRVPILMDVAVYKSQWEGEVLEV